mgnify:CR=1 FL=1
MGFAAEFVWIAPSGVERGVIAMKKLLCVLLLALSGLAQTLANAANEEFPFRVRYPDVSVITTE